MVNQNDISRIYIHGFNNYIRISIKRGPVYMLCYTIYTIYMIYTYG